MCVCVYVQAGAVFCPHAAPACFIASPFEVVFRVLCNFVSLVIFGALVVFPPRKKSVDQCVFSTDEVSISVVYIL